MKDGIQVARDLHAILGDVPAVYLRTDPEFPDFTNHASGNLLVTTSRGEARIPFDRDSTGEVVSLLAVSAFDSRLPILAWNFKNLASYIRRYEGKVRVYPGILDLKLIEGFLGRRSGPPGSFAEASGRIRKASEDLGWRRVYDEVNVHLMGRVVPAMECEGLVDIPGKRVVYAHYEIDQTPTGRMVCRVPAVGYNPHVLGSSPDYKPRDDRLFAYLDFRSMEVATLQWLTGDQGLAEALESGDAYEHSWNKVSGGSVQTPKDWKMTFLAIFFGMGVKAAADRHNWSETIAREVIARVCRMCPRATEYVREAQKQAKKGVVRDYFGRPRDLMDKPHVARNHVVQSPASVVCMEKLVELHDRMPDGARLAYSVHDGYALACDPMALRDVVPAAASILESDSRLCPGLHIQVSSRTGPRLDRMLSWKP